MGKGIVVCQQWKIILKCRAFFVISAVLSLRFVNKYKGARFCWMMNPMKVLPTLLLINLRSALLMNLQAYQTIHYFLLIQTLVKIMPSNLVIFLFV